MIFSLIGIILLGPMLSSDDTSRNKLTAIIESDKTIGRVGEGFNFTAENSKGEISNYQWDFGDSNISNGLNTNHSYEISGWYNVTLNIEDESGKIANSTMVIGVQRNDVTFDGESGRIRDLNPSSQTGNGFGIAIGPNIDQPTIEVTGVIHQAIGRFDFQIYVQTNLPDDNWDIQLIHEESLQGTGGDIVFSYIVEPIELNENVQKYSSEIDIVLFIDQGRWGSVEMYLNAVFPMEVITIYE